MSKQGDFLEELKALKTGRTKSREAFTWERDVNDPEPEVVPQTHLNSTRTVKSPKPTADISRTINGHIDLGEIRDDLVSQMKASHKARSR